MAQHDFILLDRSGSMAGPIWQESLNAINTYVKKLADNNVDTGVTLAVFDSNGPFEIIRDRITPKTWKPVVSGERINSYDTLVPRGGTPLNDATARLIDLAEKGAPWGEAYGKVAIVIVTDGDENASQEYGVRSGGTQKIKARLDACRTKDWQVVFLGANFDNQQQAAALGAAAAYTVSSTVANMGTTMDQMAMKRGLYASGTGTMEWSAAEKTAVSTDTPKPTDTTTTTAKNTRV